MQPADTALTRMYNQPTKIMPDGRHVGLLYKNPIDCLWKTFKTEGPFGWYKGSTAHFLRIAPHTYASNSSKLSLTPTQYLSTQNHNADRKRHHHRTVQANVLQHT